VIEVAGTQITRHDPADRSAAAKRRALVVRPHHHLERMPRRDARLLTGLNHLERRQRAEIAVEVSARRYRVDVRSEKDRSGGSRH
jgi:hypothetical protein